MANEINDGSDKVERPNNRGDRTSDNTADDSVIGGDRPDHQQIHQEMKSSGRTFQGMNKLYQQETGEQVDDGSGATNDESVTIVALNPDGSEVKASGKTGLNENDLVAKPHTQEFFEAKAQGAMTAFQNLDQQPQYQSDQLIAANVTNPPLVRSDATLPTSEAPSEEKVSETKISHGLPNDYDAHTFFESGEALRPAVEAGADFSGKIIENVIENEKLPIFPYRGLEDAKLAECTKENPRAWDEAASAFPQLTDHLSISQLVPLVKGIVRNEIHYYDQKDIDDDTIVKQGKGSSSGTLGYSQITPKGVHDFEQKYPQLKNFLESKGYSGPGHEGRALVDPSCVPMIVAAKLADLAEQYRNSNDKLNPQRKVEITPRSLAYGYNADVYFNPNNREKPDFHSLSIPKAKEIESLRGYVKAYPTSDERVLEASAHLRHVEQQFKRLP